MCGGGGDKLYHGSCRRLGAALKYDNHVPLLGATAVTGACSHLNPDTELA